MTDQVFDIYAFSGFNAGHLAICPEPTSDAALAQVANWNADIIVTMITVDEFSCDDFAAKITHTTPQWIQAAVTDFGVPDSDFNPIINRLVAVLNENKRIMIHCKGGQGRSGMLAMRLLVEQGEQAVDALNRIRMVRPNAVETIQQEQWASQQSK